MNPALLAIARLAPPLVIALAFGVITAQLRNHGGKMIAALRGAHLRGEHRP